MKEPNDKQKMVIDGRGILKVNAGPGTGKTETLVNRYSKLLDEGYTPDEIQVLTFTRAGASELIRRLTPKTLGKENCPAMAIRAGTFDSLNATIVSESSEIISDFLESSVLLSRNASIEESDVINNSHFSKYLEKYFAEPGNPYGEYSSIAMASCKDLYDMLMKLLSYGIIPRKKGWFGYNYEEKIKCDTENLKNKLEELNGLDPDNNLLKKMTSYLEKHDGVPDDLIVDSRVDEKYIVSAVFDEESVELEDFIHDVLYGYMLRCIEDDHLNYALNAVFAYIALFHSPELRERFGCIHLMIDEFQDTDANQLMIALMLLKKSGKNNQELPQLCVVGDFRQSIFGFRNTSSEFLQKFEEKCEEFVGYLSDNGIRWSFKEFPKPLSIELDKNYRSTQNIIDCAYNALSADPREGETRELLVSEAGEPVEAINTYLGRTSIKSVSCGADLIAAECVERVKNFCNTTETIIFDKSLADREKLEDDTYVPEDDENNYRKPVFSDISVICRTNIQAKNIYKALTSAGIPAHYNGDMEILNSKESKILLAWLRYALDKYDSRGLTGILHYEGYRPDKLKLIVSGKESVPGEIIELREHLRELMCDPAAFASAVYGRYIYNAGNILHYTVDPEISNSLIDIVRSFATSGDRILSDLEYFLVSGRASGSKFDLDKPLDTGAVLVQTIHKSKGLEYPLVIVPHISGGSFPPRPKGNYDVYSILPYGGIRCTKYIDSSGDVAESWKTAMVKKAVVESLEEYRRDLFVAVSRARQYLIAIGDGGSGFFKDVFMDRFECESPFAITGMGPEESIDDMKFERNVPKEFLQLTKSRDRLVGVHSAVKFIAEDNEDKDQLPDIESEGMDYGTRLHAAAEYLVRSKKEDLPKSMYEGLEPSDLGRVRAKILGLRSKHAQLEAELECRCDLGNGIVLNGIIDLLAIYPDKKLIEIHDWKSDKDPKVYRKAYNQQLNIYRCSVEDQYPGYTVECYLQFVRHDEKNMTVPVERIPRESLKEIVMKNLGGGEGAE